MKRLFVGLLAAGFILLATQLSFAEDVVPSKANGDFIPGSGIPGDNFTSSVTAGGQSLWIKPRGRDTGQALSILGNRYEVAPGFALNGTSPWWNFDWQMSPGPNGLSTSSFLTMKVDFNPAIATTSFVTLTGTLASWGITNNPGGGAWDPSNIPYVVADSWNYGFAFWASQPGYMPYNNAAPGEYEIQLILSDPNNAVLGQVNAFAVISAVPEPSTYALVIGTVLIGGGSYWWKRRKAQQALLA